VKFTEIENFEDFDVVLKLEFEVVHQTGRDSQALFVVFQFFSLLTLL